MEKKKSNTISMQKKEVDELIKELDEMLFAIKRSDDLLLSLEPGQAKDSYKKQLDDLLKEYKVLCVELKTILYNYFIYERKNNLPVNFNYRKLYKRLK